MRLIDADELLDILDLMIVGHKSAGDVYDVVDSMPTVDVDSLNTKHEDIGYEKGFRDGYAEALEVTDNTEPVRHGHWIAHDMSTKGVPTEACSECGEWSYGRNEEYCSCCGCKMDEAVRCGDCKWFDSKRFVDDKERPVCHRYEKIVDENNFCLKGEMKDDNNN